MAHLPLVCRDREDGHRDWPTMEDAPEEQSWRLDGKSFKEIEIKGASSVALMDRLLRIGEGKILKQLKGISEQVKAIEDDYLAMNDEELRGQTGDFRSRFEKGETLESLLPESFATVAGGQPPGAGQAAFRRPDHGWRRATPGQHRGDEDRRGQDPGFNRTGLPQRAHRSRRTHRDRQRLPGQA